MKNYILILLFFISCSSLGQNYFMSHSTSAPIITLVSVTPNQENCSFVAVANISSSGGTDIIERGIIWNNTTPTLSAYQEKSTNGQGTGSYESTFQMYGIAGGNSVYIRAYCKTIFGTYYSDIIFTSVNLNISISSLSFSNITNVSVDVSGTVNLNGHPSNLFTILIRYGISFLTNSVAATINPDGTFNGQISGLTANTTYSAAADITRCNYTYSSGNTQQFTTASTGLCPDCNTLDWDNVTSSGFRIHGYVYSDGGSSVTEKGVVINRTSIPTTSYYEYKVTSGSGIGSIYSEFSGLLPNTLYYVRAYAINSTCTDYGQQLIVYTNPTSLSIPTVITSSISNININTASSGGNVTSDGGAIVTSRGVVWNKTGNATVNLYDGKTSDGTGTGTFVSSLTGLTDATTYYVRAYATNSQGTAYGNDIQFTTTSCPSPTISTTIATNITTSSATSGGIAINGNGCTVSDRGVIWNTISTVDLNNNIGSTNECCGSTNFTSSITGLSPNTTYYYRAYCISDSYGSNNIGYGNILSFTTSSGIGLPNVTTANISNITSNTAISGGEVISDGGASVTSRGIVWSTSQNPDISSYIGKTIDGTGIGIFTSSLTGLTVGTLYYVRAYAINSAGTAYGSQVSFTPSCILPTVTTQNISSITQNSASGGGNITSDGGCSVTARGVCWNTSGNPTVSDSHTSDGTGNGSFSSSMTGLTCGTTYFTRAYATNESGTAYGNIVTFSTELCIYIPTVSLNTINKYGDTYATFSGSVTDDGNSAVTERGFVYSTTPNPTTSSNKIISGSGVGLFSVDAYGLFSSTKYYVRAYAINNVGTAYSNELDFITFESPTNVSISTSVPVNITTNSATLGGNISSDGGNTVTERGVVYGLSINPTTSNTKIQSGDGIGIYSVNVTGLTQGTTYHVRAYAINSNGTFYGADESFITSIDGTTACNAGQTFPGGQSYPSTNTIVLGSGTGDVTLTFNAYSIPDFFLVEYNSIIYSSGWRGNSGYDYGGQLRSSFMDALRGKSDPTQPQSFPTSFPNPILYPEDGYPRVNSTVVGSISFTKSTSNPTTAIVKVYAPMSRTSWTYILSCPK